MKIGIITYHKSHNYGALLQAIALRIKLVQMGHDVYFIDYWPLYHKQLYDFFSIKEMFNYGIKDAIKYGLKILLSYKKRKKRITSFMQFIEEFIQPYCIDYSTNDKFDIIIYGSDQIWRKQPELSNHFDPVYFADNILKANKHIAYAASMGNMDLSKKNYDFLKEKVNKFSHISVREEKLKFIMEEVGINSPLVLDPTLLLTNDIWERVFPIRNMFNERYVLYYRLLRNSFNEKQVADFAQRLGCKLLILEGRPRPTIKKDTISSANPIEFISLIKYADFIFTSSYHGMIFSLIFHKQFFASFSENSDRAESLLTSLDLKDHLIPHKSDIPTHIRKIDYTSIDLKINSLRSLSEKFLKESI